MEFEKKQKGRWLAKNSYYFLAGIVFLIVAAALIFVDFKIYQKKTAYLSQIDYYQKQIQEIEAENEKLKQGIENSDDINYIEKVAREELDMQKPGEKVVGFVMPEQKTQAQAPKDFWISNFLGSWLSGVWQWLKNKF